ncbi:arginyl tRNA protein transferase 1 [Echinococcus multilocularis]|uniref:Arginyl-tRNA--protein transferase 1 n=1 Tax=Echinococcus multilocularis TaxID=6211 RepID=A0A087W034_ECHMU|nr:arginyl tRNA protein transferase 1 [Echinococcus multilocularis]
MFSCGRLTYKPNNRKTCCPAYTIRCDAVNFRISKAQKKVLRVVNTYLNTGEIVKADAQCSATADCRGDRLTELDSLLCSSQNISLHSSGDSGFPGRKADPVSTGRPGSARRRRWQALQDRMARQAEKLGVSYEIILEKYLVRRRRRLEKNKPKELEEYLESMHGEAKAAHFIDVRMYSCSTRCPEFEATLDEEFKLYSAYQVAVHNDPPDKLKRKSFTRFLVDSPLVCAHDAEAEASGAPQFGTYHQQYWLDGEKLVAVGVIDLVPGCLSSVYFFYDPAYAFLRLGTYSALREIAFVRQLYRAYRSAVPVYTDFTQYYMGYYIHSCVKMRYKAQYSPSYLVCPETYAWVPLVKCWRLLDRSKYARFADGDVEKASSVDVGEAVILFPFSTHLASLLPPSQFTVEGNVITTTAAAAMQLLTKHGFRLLQDWINLVCSTGTMRVDYSH